MVVWELASGNGLLLVWVWCPFADFTLGPAVKMPFSLFTRALPCGQAQALWHWAQEAQPVTAGHCQGQLGFLLSCEVTPTLAGHQILHAAAFPEVGVCVLDRKKLFR